MKQALGRLLDRFPQAPAHVGSVAWTILIALLLGMGSITQSREQFEYALAEARAASRTDITFSRWIAQTGDVYASVSNAVHTMDRLQSNSDRDAVTADGRSVTLANPGCILEGIHKLAPDHLGLKTRLIRIDSPSVRTNTDAWDSAALREIAAGKQEIHGITEVNGVSHLRLIAPLAAEKVCLRCHQDHGLGPGQPWGAVHVDVPLNQAVFRASKDEQQANTIGLAFIWLIGLAGIQGSARIAHVRHKERERTYEELREREERYRNLIESSPDGFWLVDNDGIIRDVNEVYLRRSGYRREEILGKTVSDLEGRESPEATRQRMELLRREGGAVFDTAHRAKDGSLWPTEAKVTFSPAHGGRFAAFFRDLSGKKGAEAIARLRGQLADRIHTTHFAELIRAAIAKAEILTGSEFGYCHFINADNQHLTHAIWSAKALEIPEIAEGRFRTGPISETPRWQDCIRSRKAIFHEPAEASLSPSNPRKSSSTAHVFRELILPLRRGDRIVALVGVTNKSTPYLQADIDWLEAIASMALDLADRKRVQEELSNFFNLVPDLVCILTGSGHLRRVNRSWERLFGGSPSAPQRTSFLDRIHPEDRKATMRRFLRIVRGGSIQQFVNRCLAADGSWRWIEWNAASIPQEQLVCAAGADITDRRRAERLTLIQRDLGLSLSLAQDSGSSGILHACLEAAIEASGMECGGLYLKDPSSGDLLLETHRGLSPGFVANVCRVPADSPKSILVHQNTALYSHYSQIVQGATTLEKAEGLRAIAVITLRHGNEVIGCVNVASRSLDEIPAWGRRDVETLIPQIGTVVARLRAQSALEESEQRFRLLYDSAVDAIFWADAKAGRIAQCNRAAEKLLGLPRSEIIGHRTASIHPPDEAARYQKVFEDHAEGISTGPFEGEVMRADGSRRSVIISPSVTTIGRHTIVQGIFHDITERKRFEIELRRHQTLIEAIFDNVPIMICLLDEHGEIQNMNRALSRLAQSHPKSANPRSLCQVLGCAQALDLIDSSCGGPACRDCTLRLATEETRRSGNGKRQIEFTVPRVVRGKIQHSRLAASTAVVPIENHDKVLVCIEDITTARQLEIEYRQAQKMEAVGQLAGGVAHDFNNILGAMIMNLHLALDAPQLDRETVAILRELEEEARRAADLTRQLLLFSRRETAQRKRLNLNSIVEGLLKMLRRILGEHIDLTFRPSPSPLWTDADSGMIEQVIMNLCVNARDAMAKGGPLQLHTDSIDVSPELAHAKAEARAGSFVRLSVIDAGSGIEPDILDRIFDPFFTTKAPGAGTGLGLATVYGIVQQHRGWIDVQSAPGHGTTFHVYLPTAPPESTPAPGELAASLPRGTETILIVEDDPQLLKTAGLVLRGCGYRMLEARNGAEALAVWKDSGSHIQLVFTDVVMPGGMTGLELADRLRQSDPSLPIVLTSGYSSDLANAGGRPPSGMAFLAKPYTPTSLAVALRQCLDRANPRH